MTIIVDRKTKENNQKIIQRLQEDIDVVEINTSYCEDSTEAGLRLYKACVDYAACIVIVSDVEVAEFLKDNNILVIVV